MVVRNPLQCVGCESVIITRTQIGHKDKQEHSFPCPRCGVTISYIVDLDQQHGKWKFRPPTNARGANSEVGAIATLAFSDEIPVPIEMGRMFSPFLATIWNIRDLDSYRHDETLRQLLVSRHFQYAERCMVHFERQNWELFDKESPSLSHEPQTPSGRLIDLCTFFTGAFSKISLNSEGKRERIRQRLALARVSDLGLFRKLATALLRRGRIRQLWTDIAAVRKSVVNAYPAIQPLVRMRYWREELQDFAKFSISVKKFDELRQLYIDTFETLCRLMEFAMGVEVIIHHKKLELPAKKRQMTLAEFAALPNASKLSHIARYPIEDLFLPVLDTEFRNSVGHNAAHYDAATDSVVLYDPRRPGHAERRIPYTQFCDRVLRLFAAFELAAMYHHSIHIFVHGRFE